MLKESTRDHAKNIYNASDDNNKENYLDSELRFKPVTP